MPEDVPDDDGKEAALRPEQHDEAMKQRENGPQPHRLTGQGADSAMAHLREREKNRAFEPPEQHESDNSDR